MSDNIPLNASGVNAMEGVKKLGVLSRKATSSGDETQHGCQKHKFLFSENDEKVEEKKACRICHEDDFPKNLEAPCACNGSSKMAHRACIQKWCNEKRSIICEICKQPYRDGYKLSPPVPQTTLDVDDSDGWEDEIFRNRLFPTAERHPLFAINPNDGRANGQRVRSVIFLAILLISMDVMMIWVAYSVLVEHIGSMLSTILLLFCVFFMLIYTLAWVGNPSAPRRRRQETTGAAARLNAIPVGTPIPQSMHRRRVVQHQSDSHEDDDSVAE